MKNSIIKNIFSSLFCQVIAIIYGLIVPILIIKTFGSNINGLVTSITQFLNYIILLEAGIGPIIKNALFKPLVDKNKSSIEKILGASDNFFKKISIIFLGYLFLLCVFYPLIINSKFDFIFTVSLILIISISLFFEYFLGMKYKLFLQSDQKNYVVDYVNALTYILNLIIIVFLLKIGANIQLVKLSSTFSYVLRPIFMKIYFDKKYGYKIDKKSDYKFEKKWDGITHHIASVVQSNTDVVVLTLFSSMLNVSIYSVYNLIINGVRSISVAFTNGMDAFFGKMMVNYKNNDINKKFSIYSVFFYTVITILLSCCVVLIIPFVSLYTSNIHDANYVQPLFAYVMVIAEFLYIIRYPYSTIVYSKGHFKETSFFSIIEPIVNIIVSIFLVRRFGLIGVALGTLISMPIRSIGFIVYATKNILKSNLYNSFKIIVISFVELLIICFVNYNFVFFQIDNFFSWVIYALILILIISLIIITINILFFRDTFKMLFKGGKKC